MNSDIDCGVWAEASAADAAAMSEAWSVCMRL